MKTKQEILTELAEQKLIETIARNIGGYDEDIPDLCQDLYISLMQKDEALIQSLYTEGQMNFYVTRMVINNIRSTNSPFYTTYKKNKLIKEDIEDEKL